MNSALYAGPAAGLPPLGRCAVVMIAYLALAGGGLWGGLALAGTEPGLGETVFCAAPVALAAALAITSQDDRPQYIARLLAAALMLPLLLLMWAASQDVVLDAPRLPMWGFVVAFGGLHALAFVAGIGWLAAATTRIEPAPGVAAVSLSRLAERLRSLNDAGLALDVAAGESPLHWAVDHRRPAGDRRSHRVLLDIDVSRREVRVRERIGASGARPQDADESSMQPFDGLAHDPARPRARRVWSRQLQTTLIEPQRLAAVALVFRDDRVEAAAVDDDAQALLALLCALVVRSGFAWQPVLFARRR